MPAPPEGPTAAARPPHSAPTLRWGPPPAQGHGAEAGARGCKHLGGRTGRPRGEKRGDSLQSAERETEAGRGGGGGWGPGTQSGLRPAGSLRWRWPAGRKVTATVTSGEAEPTRRGAHLGREQQQGYGQPRRRHVRRSHRSSRRKVSRQRLRDSATRRRQICACANGPLARKGRGGACPERRAAARWR